MTDYKELCEDVRAYTEGVPHLIANLANASALLWQRLSDIDSPEPGRFTGEDQTGLAAFVRVLEETLF